MKKRRVREAEEVGDAMKSSEENVTLDSKRELDEMKSMEVRTCFGNCLWPVWMEGRRRGSGGE